MKKLKTPILIILAAFNIGLFFISVSASENELKVYFFDVGQGDSILTMATQYNHSFSKLN